MNNLSKTTRVLNLDRTEFGFARFEHDATGVSLDERTWDDMGAPVVVTVTIEPGDLLNP